jgi:hypothetical protein
MIRRRPSRTPSSTSTSGRVRRSVGTFRIDRRSGESRHLERRRPRDARPDRRRRLGSRLFDQQGRLQPHGPRPRQGAAPVQHRRHRPDARFRRHRAHDGRAGGAQLRRVEGACRWRTPVGFASCCRPRRTRSTSPARTSAAPASTRRTRSWISTDGERYARRDRASARRGRCSRRSERTNGVRRGGRIRSRFDRGWSTRSRSRASV